MISVVSILMGKKLTLEQVQRGLESRGYALLSKEYKNAHSKLECKCPKGHKILVRWNDIRSHKYVCPDCTGLQKKTIEEARNMFEQQGFVLLSTQYINSYSKLSYKCSRGHINQTTWSRVQQGFGCPDCDDEDKKHTTEQVRRVFEERGYQLLSDYRGSHSKLDFICPKGHRGQMIWTSFQQGCNCFKCMDWKNQRKLGEILEQIFPDKVRAQDNLDFLGRQKVDFSVREMGLAFEYDGEPHFKPVRYGSMSEHRAKKLLKKQQKRDYKKSLLCQKRGIILIRIAYNETLSIDNVNKKLQQCSPLFGE